MSKKVGIIIGVVAAVTIVGGFLGWWLTKDKTLNVDNPELNIEKPILDNENLDEEKFVGAPLPNIVNRAGTIKKVKRSSVIINGPDNEDIRINIDDDTKIYGPDGNERVIDDLIEGMYITVDIDGDKIEEESENEFDALIIYISGK